MTQEPHFDVLCWENEAGLALAVLLIPLEIFILAVAGSEAVLERKAGSGSATSSRMAASPELA